MRQPFVAFLVIGLCLLGLTAIPALAQAPVALPAGDDGLQTAGPNNDTHTSLSGVVLPGGCGTGDATFSGSIDLKGVTLHRQLPNIDTIVRRLTSTPPLYVGDSATVSIQILALRLNSKSAVTADCDDGTTRNFNISVYLSSFGQTLGSMDITRTGPDGGEFNSDLHVTPKYVFKPVGGGTNISVDCGVDPNCGTLDFASVGSKWTIVGGPGGFDPAAEGIQTVAAGVGLDTDGNGTIDAYTNGSSNFTAGFDSDFWIKAALFELQLLAQHEADSPILPDPPPPCDDAEPVLTQKAVTGTTTTTTIGQAEPCGPILVDVSPNEPVGTTTTTTVLEP